MTQTKNRKGMTEETIRHDEEELSKVNSETVSDFEIMRKNFTEQIKYFEKDIERFNQRCKHENVEMFFVYDVCVTLKNIE